uniref:ubiquitinyl hydrolase 1 n=1 Tax=Macrostomum lignano TaxID=282301 RepID=A0A1I8ITK4_9PLAT
MPKKKRQSAAPAGGGRCPHLQAGVDLAAVRKTLRQLGGTADAQPCRPVCDGCAGGATGGLWLCLRCAAAGCGRYTDCRQALKHFKTASHPVAVSMDQLQAWCYVCDRELPTSGSGEFATACNLLRCHADRLAALPAAAAVDGRRAVSAAAGRECRGLSNLGNTCFFNSILQCLAHLPGLADLLAQHAVAASGELTLPAGAEPLRLRLTEPAGRTTKCLAATLAAIRSGQQAPHRPSDLLGQVMERNPRFRGRQQQDAHELLRTLLDASKTEEVRRIQTAILASLGLGKGSDPKQVPQELRDRARALNHSARDSTVIDAEFSGRLVSELVCLQCGRASRTPEIFQDLMLPITETVHHRPSAAPRSVSPSTSSTAGTPEPKQRREKNRRQQRLTKKQQKRAAKQQRQQQIEKGRLDEMEAEKKLESLTLGDKADEPEIEKAELDSRAVENPDKADGSAGEGAEKPAAEELVVKEAGAEKPAAEESEMKVAGAEKPAAGELEMMEAGAEKPAAEELVVKEAGVEKPAADESEMKEAGAEKPAAEESEMEEAGAEKPAAEESEMEEAGAEKPAAEELEMKEVGAEKPAAEESEMEEVGAEKPADEELVVKEAGAEKPAAEESEMEEAGAEKPAAEESEMKEAGAEKPAAEESVVKEAQQDASKEQAVQDARSDVDSSMEAESGTPELLNRTDTLEGCLADSSEPEETDNKASTKAPPSASQPLRAAAPPGTLEHCLFQFTAAELLTAGNRFRCEGCGAATDHSKRLLIDQPPRLLTLQLKRFAQQGRQLRKSGSHIRCPLLLRLAVASGQLIDFQLCSIVEHSGSLAGGHYTAYVCAQSGRWYHISDSHVSPASEAQALNAEAYLLFYARIGPAVSAELLSQCLLSQYLLSQYLLSRCLLSRCLLSQCLLSRCPLSRCPLSWCPLTQSRCLASRPLRTLRLPARVFGSLRPPAALHHGLLAMANPTEPWAAAILSTTAGPNFASSRVVVAHRMMQAASKMTRRFWPESGSTKSSATPISPITVVLYTQTPMVLESLSASS